MHKNLQSNHHADLLKHEYTLASCNTLANETRKGAGKRRTARRRNGGPSPRSREFSAGSRSRLVNLLKIFSILPADDCFVASCRLAFSHRALGMKTAPSSWPRISDPYLRIRLRLCLLAKTEEERKKGER